MELGMIGLGRMGANMTERLVLGGHKVITYDRSAEAIQRVVDKGALGSPFTWPTSSSKWSLPRAIWLMVPSGDPVDQTIEQLLPTLAKGDIIIDGGNSNYKDSIRRAEKLQAHGHPLCRCRHQRRHLGFAERLLHDGRRRERGGRPPGADLYDAGAQGRLSARRAQRRRSLRQDDSQRHRVRHDAGVRRGLRAAQEVAVRSRSGAKCPKCGSRAASCARGCSSCGQSAFEKDPKLDAIKGWVDDSGEGRWTVIEAIEKGVAGAESWPCRCSARFSSRQQDSFSGKVIAALRNEFGGHAVKKE